jgi:hypothetical protein
MNPIAAKAQIAGAPAISSWTSRVWLSAARRVAIGQKRTVREPGCVSELRHEGSDLNGYSLLARLINHIETAMELEQSLTP